MPWLRFRNEISVLETPAPERLAAGVELRCRWNALPKFQKTSNEEMPE
jgi:hypothetical protein